MNQWRSALLNFGAAVAPVVLPPAEADALFGVVGQAVDVEGRAGHRGLHDLPAVRELAQRGPLARLAVDVVGGGARVVRVLWFDKTPGANWSIPFHQDLTIAVRERAEVPGYGPWSVKQGIVHVQPPVAILEGMVAVRLHLDDCLEGNGPLRIVEGSHRLGRIPERQIEPYAARSEPMMLEARKGDVVLMRPLTLHASSPSRSPGHRRVLHIEYSSCELGPPLRWHLGWQTMAVDG